MQLKLGSNSSICHNAGLDEKKRFWFQRPDLAVLLAAYAGNQQWSRRYFSNIL